MINGEASGIDIRIKAARERLGWSREALAFHSGISWSAIAQIEAGRRRNLRPNTLSALADALGVTIDYIVRGTPGAPMFNHQALLYGSDEEFLGTAGPFLAEGVERSEATLVVTSASNLELLREHLGSASREIDFADASDWYSSPGAAFSAYDSFASSKLEDGAPWVRVIGEPMWHGRSDSEIRRWTRYESLLNLAFAASPLTIMCPYNKRKLDPEIVRQARVTHPHTCEDEGMTNSPDYANPSGFVLDG